MSESVRGRVEEHEPPWTAKDDSFGSRLALIRQHMSWNVKEAALACGIPPQSWRTWETGVMPHGGRYFELCAQIAGTVHCDYGWLVDRRPSGSDQPTAAKVRVQLRRIQGGGRASRIQPPLLASL